MICLSCCGVLAVSVGFAVFVIYDLEQQSAYWEDQNSNSLETIEQYKDKETDYKSTINKSLETIEQYKDKETDYKSTINRLEQQSAYWENQNSKSLERIEQYKDKETDYKSTISDLEYNYDDLAYDYDDLAYDYDEFYASFYGDGTKFLTMIEDGTVVWDFVDSKENSYAWEMPMRSYEELVLDGALASLNSNKHQLSLNGRTINMIQYEQFVVGGFTETIDDLYHNSNSNSDFIWEVWWIVSQMTVYREDLDERSEGRFALETFTRQGGDCEDLSILIADMLASSKYTKNWTIQLVLMDTDTPTDPRTINHMIVYVNDGVYDYYIEATGDPSWDYYEDGVSGWWFDVSV